MIWDLYLWEGQDSYDIGDECDISPASIESKGEHYPPRLGEHISYSTLDNGHCVVYEAIITKIVHEYSGEHICILAILTDTFVDGKKHDGIYYGPTD